MCISFSLKLKKYNNQLTLEHRPCLKSPLECTISERETESLDMYSADVTHEFKLPDFATLWLSWTQPHHWPHETSQPHEMDAEDCRWQSL